LLVNVLEVFVTVLGMASWHLISPLRHPSIQLFKTLWTTTTVVRLVASSDRLKSNHRHPTSDIRRPTSTIPNINRSVFQREQVANPVEDQPWDRSQIPDAFFIQKDWKEEHNYDQTVGLPLHRKKNVRHCRQALHITWAWTSIVICQAG
jgi:hypothetical protein